MGVHLLDLVAATVEDAEVSVMCRPTTGGQRVLRRAADLGAVTMALPSPREAGFGFLVRQFLRATRPDVFHCHVGIGWEGWGNLETARRAGVPVIMQTQHLPFLLGNRHKRRGLLKAVKEADCVIAVSDGVRRTYEAIGVPSERLITVPNGVARCEAVPVEMPSGPGSGSASTSQLS